MLRLLHTSDWHLGQNLRDLGREEEHAHFLQWLLQFLQKEHFHATLIAGDIFDGPNPSARSQEMLYQFLEQARKYTTLIVIAGNHDSAERLDAPASLLRQLGIFVAGVWPANDQSEKLLFPIQGEGEQGLVLAMPFLRNSDLGNINTQEPNWYAQAHRRRWELLRNAVAKSPGCLIGMGHCYVSGASINEDTERRIGNQDEIPADVFPQDLTYLALGHLHKSQRIGGKEHIRYSGSVLPLGFSEIEYTHQVLEVQIEGGVFQKTISHAIPRYRELLRIPTRHAPWDAVKEAIQALPDNTSAGVRPWAEVRIQLPTGGMADLRNQVQELFASKQAMLFRIDALAGELQASALVHDGRSLDDLLPREVFQRLCQDRQLDESAQQELLQDFEELLREKGLA